MHLLTLIFGIVLLPKAYTLKCFECVPGISGTCTDVAKECPSGERCSAIRMTLYGGPKPTDVNMKGCASADECGEASFSFGITRIAVNSKCCDSELCNRVSAPEPSLSYPNGKKCFSCDGKGCSATVKCEGKEDYCLSATVNAGGQKTTMKGCASKMICSTQSAQIPGVGGAELNCCQGDYCNSASSTSAGLLLLVAPLVSLVVLS